MPRLGTAFCSCEACGKTNPSMKDLSCVRPTEHCRSIRRFEMFIVARYDGHKSLSMAPYEDQVVAACSELGRIMSEYKKT